MCKSFKLFMKKLRTCCLFPRVSNRDEDGSEFEEDMNAATTVPEDVKEGHVAVVAVKGGRAKRLILELRELSNPEFLRLLEQAKEEFGFQQKGPLAIPCQPEEVQKILEGRRKESSGFDR